MSAVHQRVCDDTPEGVEFHRYVRDPDDLTFDKELEFTPYVVLEDGVWSDGVTIHPWHMIYAPEWEGNTELTLWRMTGLRKHKEKYDIIIKTVDGWVELAEERDKRKVLRRQNGS